MRKTFSYILLIALSFLFSCSKTTGNQEGQANTIRLKWFSSHQKDSFESHTIALKWCLSYLGSNKIVIDDSEAFTYNNPHITLDINKLGFDDNAINQLKKLHLIFKTSEEYKKHGAFDIGKYIVMTLGSSHHYYKIHNTPKNIDTYTTLYLFNELKGYINNSSISNPKINRIVSYSTLTEKYKQAYISKEIDAESKEVKEFEMFERMSNGQLKFAVYNVNGNLIPNSNHQVGGAGKPAKCIWCHEVVIQPTFRPQNDFRGYLSAPQLLDTLVFYGLELRNYQNSLWKESAIKNTELHTNMELTYIN